MNVTGIITNCVDFISVTITPNIIDSESAIMILKNICMPISMYPIGEILNPNLTNAILVGNTELVTSAKVPVEFKPLIIEPIDTLNPIIYTIALSKDTIPAESIFADSIETLEIGVDSKVSKVLSIFSVEIAVTII